MNEYHRCVVVQKKKKEEFFYYFHIEDIGDQQLVSEKILWR